VNLATNTQLKESVALLEKAIASPGPIAGDALWMDKAHPMELVKQPGASWIVCFGDGSCAEVLSDLLQFAR
jgi:hypothetical protein